MSYCIEGLTARKEELSDVRKIFFLFEWGPKTRNREVDGPVPSKMGVGTSTECCSAVHART